MNGESAVSDTLSKKESLSVSASSSIAGILPMNAISATWPLLLGMGVLMLGTGLQSTLLGLRATLEGFPTVVTGVIMSCYYVGYLLGTRIAPPLLRRLGHIRVFATLAAVSSAAILVQGCFVNPFTWGMMRMLSGVCLAGIYVVAESWLNDRATRANRGTLFAIYMGVLYVGLGAAQFLAGSRKPAHANPVHAGLGAHLTRHGSHRGFLAARTPSTRSRKKYIWWDLYRNSPLGVVAIAVSGMISAFIFSMGPVYARLSGLETSGVATFMAVSILAAVVTQYPVGRLSDRMDRRTVIAAVCYTRGVRRRQHRRLPRNAAWGIAGIRGAVQRLRVDTLFAIGIARER